STRTKACKIKGTWVSVLISTGKRPRAVSVIFGATGDVAKCKLYPSIYRLVENGEISDDFAVVGTARRPWTHEVFRDKAKESIHEHESDEREIDAFLSHFYYHRLDVRDSDSYEKME